jgi:ABC-type sugar transport system ATPase subunit
MQRTSDDALLALVSIEKHFGGVRALRGADLALRAGEVHALVGENGSGKSTLLNILSGQVRPDSGKVLLDGTEVVLPNPTTALAHGIVTVTQETTLVPDLSVAENILLGNRMVKTRGRIDWRATRALSRQVLDQLDLQLDPGTVVRRLRPDQQQMVEIARAMSMRARILILDEPTSSLTADEVQALFSVVHRLRDQSVAVIFVSHRLGEVFALADRYTVLRDGRTVGAGSLGEIDQSGLVSIMIGKAHIDAPPSRAQVTPGQPALQVTNLTVPGRVRNASFALNHGEILGIAGLVGAGRSELLEALFGLHKGVEGEVLLDGERVSFTSPRSAISRGIAFVPSDRKRLGLVLSRSLRHNIMMAATAHRARLGFPRKATEARVVSGAIRDLRIAASGPSADASTLSGGNQQKVVLAKWFTVSPSVMMLDEPTRGVDVGAKAEIYRLLREAADRGVGVLVSSSESPELLTLCDRILIMFRGQVTSQLLREDATEAAITRHAMGADA